MVVACALRSEEARGRALLQNKGSDTLVKMPCIMAVEGAECIAPSVATAIDRTYPIARPLFMYTAGQPEGTIREYLDWIPSDEGQCIILDKGYAPVRTVACG